VVSAACASLTLLVQPGELAVRLPPDAHAALFSPVPGAWQTRTDEELSLVRAADAVPSDARSAAGVPAHRRHH
jgi:hypothetical protein